MNPSPPETRASLIVRLPNATDAAAWEEFVAIYAPLVLRLAHKQGLQASDADDLVQEVFTSVAQSVRDWLERKDRGRFRGWLFRIARNAAVNLLTRRATRTLGKGGDDATSDIRNMPDERTDTESIFDLEYRRETFRWAAEQVRQSVAKETWQAFWLTHVECVPIVEAAKTLNMSVGRVYVSRSRVMSRLQQLVHQLEAEQ